MWLSIDDTDSPDGMCTTYLLTEIIFKLSEFDPRLDIIGYPRLVRLNPNIPWKTRGNGALAVNIGTGKGRKRLIGEMNDKPVYGYEYGEDLGEDEERREKILEIARKIVESNSMLECEKTNPGIAIGDPGDDYFYEKAVKSVLTIEEAIEYLEGIRARWVKIKNGRGLIGAAAAISWSGRRSTYELIAYRKPWNWGERREIDPDSVIQLDEEMKNTFGNYDYVNKHVCIAPASPCPVLFGVRAFDPSIEPALRIINSEEVHRWLIFETNQATDDHLQRKRIGEIRRYDSVITRGVVYGKVQISRGGHLFFNLTDGADRITVAAYEPTKEFRGWIAKLVEGDEVEVYGSVGKYSSINLEKIKIEKLRKIYRPPRCPNCGKSMKSKGKGVYKCRNCRIKSGGVEVDRGLELGYYEVAVSARRHLSKPL